MTNGFHAQSPADLQFPGGRMGAHEALTSLRIVCRALHAWVIPEQASVAEAWKVFDPNGELKNEEMGK